MYGPATGPTPPYTPPAAPYTDPGPYGARPNGGYPPAPLAWYGPGYAVAPRPRSTAARVGLFLLRAFLACVPLATVGMLSWVPLVRIALVRRRIRDWIALVTAAVLACSAIVLIGTAHNDESPQADAGVALLLFLAVGCTIYFLVAELRKPARAQAPPPQPPFLPGVPLVPLGQVQAELDELSALLHRHERPTP